jgi:hypothetical protein
MSWFLAVNTFLLVDEYPKKEDGQTLIPQPFILNPKLVNTFLLVDEYPKKEDGQTLIPQPYTLNPKLVNTFLLVDVPEERRWPNPNPPTLHPKP